MNTTPIQHNCTSYSNKPGIRLVHMYDASISTRTLTQVRYAYEHKTPALALAPVTPPLPTPSPESQATHMSTRPTQVQFPSPSWVSVGLDTFVCLSADEKYLFLLCLNCPDSHVRHNDTSTNTRRKKFLFLMLPSSQFTHTFSCA